MLSYAVLPGLAPVQPGAGPGQYSPWDRGVRSDLGGPGGREHKNRVRPHRDLQSHPSSCTGEVDAPRELTGYPSGPLGPTKPTGPSGPLGPWGGTQHRRGYQ